MNWGGGIKLFWEKLISHQAKNESDFNHELSEAITSWPCYYCVPVYEGSNFGYYCISALLKQLLWRWLIHSDETTKRLKLIVWT